MKNNNTKNIKIRDFRNKQFFQIDDKYLNGYAKLCGWQATLVYVSLTRHSNKDQFCFPSIKLMSEELNISKRSVQRGIENLQKFNIIDVYKIRTKKGLWKNNSYTLLDKSVWRLSIIKSTQTPVSPMDKDTIQTPMSPVDKDDKDIIQTPVSPVDKDTIQTPVSPMDKPSPEACEAPDEAPVGPTKDTHSKETHSIKETHIINETQNLNSNIIIDEHSHKDRIKIIDIFKKTNPSLTYTNKTQYKAIDNLFKSIGIETTEQAAKYAVSIQLEPYAPIVTTPWELFQKLTKVVAFYNKKKKGGRIGNIEAFLNRKK